MDIYKWMAVAGLVSLVLLGGLLYSNEQDKKKLAALMKQHEDDLDAIARNVGGRRSD